jgi:hypothetical protein
MAKIDGITVRFSDGIKTVDYAPPRLYDITANVVLAGDDDLEVVLTSTLTAIQRAGFAALHGKAVGPATAPPQAAEEAAKPTRTRRTNAQIAADKAAEDAAKTPAADASAIGDDIPLDGPTSTGAASAASDPSAIVDAEVEDWEKPTVAAEVKPITDADLNSAVQKRNAELGNPSQIRELIATFNPDPTKQFTLREIPAAKRPDFLVKLAALVKAG